MTEYDPNLSFDPTANPHMSDVEVVSLAGEVMAEVARFEPRFPIVPFSSGSDEIETRYEPALPLACEQTKMATKDSLDTDIKSVTGSIIDEVARYYGVSLEELEGPNRARNLVRARQMAAYIIRERTDYSYPDIGKLFGGRDHTTMISGYKKVKKEILNKKASTLEDHEILMAGLRDGLVLSKSGKFQTVASTQTQLVTLSRHGIVRFPVTLVTEGAKKTLGLKGEFTLDWDKGESGVELWKKYGPAARAIMHYIARHANGEAEFALSQEHIRDFLEGRS